MSLDLRDAYLITLLLTLVPVLAAAILAVLTFWRMGYGRIGKYVCFGFLALGAALTASIALSLLDPVYSTEIIRLGVGIIRLAGWCSIAIGLMYLWVETDRI